MFSIRGSSFSDCLSCDLLESSSCLFDTNCKDDLSKVDLIIVAENPGRTEIEKEIPLVGLSGKTFRKYFDLYLKKYVNYLITNVVLCQTLNEEGKTGNPNEKTIELCKHNLFNIINICKPKLIMCMGDSPKKALNIEGKITQIQNQIFKWNNYDVLITLHPSYVNRNRHKPEIEESYKNCFIKCKNILNIDNKENKKDNKENKKGIIYYNIPEKFYSGDYRLVDVQYLNTANQILYIFRDKDNKKIFHKENNNYYIFECPADIENRYIMKYDDLYQKQIKYNEKKSLNPSITYEGDIKIQDKHAIDYYIKVKDKDLKAGKDLNILYLDIEINTSGSREFPNADEAKFPICLITTYFRDEIKTYVIDNKKNEIDINKKGIFVFKDEKEMMKKFLSDFRETDLDILGGYNVIMFDMMYIFNRLNNLGLNGNMLSTFNEFYIDPYTEFCHIPGIVCLDMLMLYKSFAQEKKESYKLKYIAQLELGETKLEFKESFSEIYLNDINKFIDYNRQDVLLLVKLEEKLKHIRLFTELRKICSGSFRGCYSKFGQLDNLVIKFLKERGLACRNSMPIKTEEKLPGAYVKEPLTGIHDYIVDFDYSSLYPSEILTYNIGINTFKYKIINRSDCYNFIYDFDKLQDKIKIIEDPVYKNELIEIDKNELLKIVKDNNYVYTINGCIFTDHNNETSFYSNILNYLLSSRKEFKNLMFDAKKNKNNELEELYDTRQWVFKILANSLYGVLGNSAYRFFNLDLASAITLSGQESIKTAIIHANEYVEKVLKYKDLNFNINNFMKINENDLFEELSFKSDNIITSDTDSIFVTYNECIINNNIKEENIFNTIEGWCNEIQSYLNDNIIKQLIKKHNVDESKNKLSLKNELIIKRGLFLAKKRYSLHVKYQEGREVDKIVSKGIELRRSDFSSYTKECLSELLDILFKMKKVSIKKLEDYVKEKESDFIKRINLGDKTVARPVSYTKKLEDYKVIPQNVISMENWNKLMYHIFVPGTKGFMYKIFSIDADKCPKDIYERYHKEFIEKGKKLEVICLPDEELKLPEFFKIDIKEMVDFHWKDRYELLLAPLFQTKNEEKILKW